MDFLRMIQSNVDVLTSLAIVCGDCSISYNDLGEKLRKLDSKLFAAGVRAGDKVILLTNRNAQYLMLLIVLLKMGCVVIPVTKKTPSHRQDMIIEDCKPQYMIEIDHDDIKINVMPFLGIKDQNIVDIAYILYTSGSTGMPKGVAIYRKALDYLFAVANPIVFHGEESSVFLGVTPFGFDMHIYEVLSPLILGKTIVIATDEEVENPRILARMMDRHKVDTVLTTPSRLDWLMKGNRDRSFMRHLRLVQLGGEGISKHLIQDIEKFSNARIVNEYGPTETTVFVTAKEIVSEKDITIGETLPGISISIRDDDMCEVRNGVVGEICIEGPTLACGYYRNQELTDRAFILLDGRRIYRTGDLGYKVKDGKEYVVVGRKDRQIKLHGNRIEMDEVEICIKDMPGIINAIVFYDDQRDCLCAGYVTSDDIRPEHIRDYLSRKLPVYMKPQIVKRVTMIEVTTNGKVDREKTVSKWFR